MCFLDVGDMEIFFFPFVILGKNAFDLIISPSKKIIPVMWGQV